LQSSESEFDYIEALSPFENLQIQSTFILIDIRLTIEDVTDMLSKNLKSKPQHILLPKQIIINNDDNKLIHIRNQLPSSMITLYDYLDIVDITLNSQFLRTTISESVKFLLYFYFFLKFVTLLFD